MIRLRHASALAIALASIAAFATPQQASAQCLFKCGFSENGKGGPFIQAEVKEKDLAESDATIAAAQAEGALGAGTIDSGELFGTGFSMPETEAALEALVESFRPHWPYRQPGPIDVKIIGSYGFSPLANPDNVIVVPLGMILRAESDDEIAWVMAHEFSHFALGHFAEDVKSRKRHQLIGSLTSVLDGGAVLASSKFRFTGENGLQQTGFDQKKANQLSGAISSRSDRLRTLMSLVGHSFTRKHEDQADVAGFDLAYAAGFADLGASNAIAQLGNDDEQRRDLMTGIGESLEEFGKIKGGRLLASFGQNTGSLKQQGGNLLGNLLGNFKEIAIGEIVSHLSVTHRPSDDRREGVTEYVERAYPDMEFRDPKSQWLAGVRNSDEVTQGRLALDAKARASELKQAGDLNGAIDAIVPVLDTRYGRSPVILNTAADIFMAAGDNAEAEKLYSAALALENTPDNPFIAQSVGGFGQHIDLLIMMGNTARAQTVLDTATERFGDGVAFLPQQVRIAVVTNNTDLLAQSMNQCASVGDDGLFEQCRYALFGPEAETLYALMTPVERAKVDRARNTVGQRAQSGGLFKGLSELVGSK